MSERDGVPTTEAGVHTSEFRTDERVVIAGVATRAFAESAARAGFSVTAIDGFADIDADPLVRILSLPRDFNAPVSALAAARAAEGIQCDAAAYVSTFENHPKAVRLLAAGRALWGNPPNVLQRVRDPLIVMGALRQRGLPAPVVHVAVGQAERIALDALEGTGHPWLVKPIASGGGRAVVRWTAGIPVPRGSYLQQYIDGTPGSVVFVAASGRAVALGISQQLIGEAAFGADGFRYCGNILLPAHDTAFDRHDALAEAACRLAQAVTEEFGVVGVNGVDFVSVDGVPYPVEINPRWSASMELVERAYGVSVFGVHAAACSTGRLPEFDLLEVREHSPAVGKAVVFARTDLRAPDTRTWLQNRDIRDIPQPYERIPAGRPVCTVFASGRDSAACYARLVEGAARVQAQLA